MKSTDIKLKWRIFVLSFFCVNLFLSSYYLDIWPTTNPVSRALPVLTYSENKTLQIDKYANETTDKSRVGEHYYSDKPPLPTILVIPVYELSKLIGLDKVSNETGKKFPVYVWHFLGLYDGRNSIVPDLIPIFLIADFLYSSLPFTLIILFSFLSLHKNKSLFSPVLLSMLTFYGSFIFVFSGTFFNHILAGFLLLISFILLKDKKYFLSGILLGLSFLTEYPVLVAAPIWCILIFINEKNIRKSILLALGVLPSLVLIMFYNWQISGQPFKMLNAFHADETYKELAHNYGFHLPSSASIWGLTFSGSMGIFIFAPVLLIIAFYLIKKLINDNKFIKVMSTDYLAIFSIIFFLIISSFFTWWGGWTYGPRYLIVLVILLLYEGLLFISKYKFSYFAFIILSLVGFISAWIAKATLVYMVPDYFLHNDKYSNTFTSILLPEFTAERFNANNFLSAFFDAEPSSGAYFWLLLFSMSTIGFYFWYKSLFPPVKLKIQKANKRLSNHKR